MINTSKAYEDYVVFVDSKALRGRSKVEYLRDPLNPATRAATQLALAQNPISFELAAMPW